MNLLIQLSTAGVNAGPFDIYYDSVSAPNLLATGITRSQLLSGYYVSSVPDTAVLILLKDTGACNTTTSLNIPVTYTAWSPVGNSLSIPNNWPAITTLTTSSVTVYNDQDDSVRAYSFNGTDWSQLGNTLTITGAGRGGVAALSSTRIAWVADGTNQLRTYDFDGTNFTQLGSSFSLSASINDPAICAMFSTRVAILDEGVGSLVAYDFNTITNTWSQKGNAYLSVGGFASKVVALSTSRVVTFEGSSGNTRVFDFDGTNWTLVSTQYINANITAMCRLAQDTIGYIEDGSDVLKIYKYISNTWTDQNVNYTLTGVLQPAITAMTPKRVAFIDNGNDTLRTFDLSTNVVSPSPSITPSITTSPNSSVSVTPSITITPTRTPSITATPSPTPSQGSGIVTSGLVLNLDAANPASYPGSGTSWTNLNGLSFSATLAGGYSYSTDGGGSIQFDGSSASGSINPAQFTNIPTGSAARTISAYVKVGSLNKTYQWVFSYGNTSSNYNAFFMGASNTTWGFAGAIGDGPFDTEYWTGFESQWVLMTMTYDGTNANLYRNGTARISNYTINFTTTNSQILIGEQLSPFGPELWNGKIRGIQIYNRALSQSEIQQNYNFFASSSVPTSPSVTPSITSSPNTTVSITPSITRTPSITPTNSSFDPYGGTFQTNYGNPMDTPFEVGGYYAWLPSTYNTKPLPVITWFHGAGEIGDGTSNASTGLPKLLNIEIPQLIYNGGTPYFNYEAIVIMPQYGSFNPFPYVDKVLNYVKNNYNTDPNRYYLTGLSLGAETILRWGNTGSLSTVASMAALCTPTYPNDSRWPSASANFKSRNMPMYFFHGTLDSTAPVSASISWVNTLNTAPSINPAAKINLLSGWDHNIWDTVYQYGFDIGDGTGRNVYQWLLSYTL